ncbi:sensor histidine kinase [Micromonospora endolithica]|uniref:histidine kinase n=1 Tax=Micromonospora endolithica TaxID=230091 RepID=A0A3A9ZHI2_9ACTN|nr:sensor histidine kinase [Micromonospora endolithica]RKN47861.1 sensor histidine kinase [Micromonospora endolithica]TWJ21557.1 histidine kinase/DNA gyrase B/HSP90-like ATPase [Micromonospora endolithica]
MTAHPSADERQSIRSGWLVDLLVAGAGGAAITVHTSVATEPTSHSSSLAAYAFGVVLGGLLLVRRRWPTGVLVGSLLAVVVYNLTDLPSVSPTWPLLVPLYTVARTGRMLLAGLVGGSMLAVSVGWIAWTERRPLEALDGALREAVLLALVLALATATRNRERWARELRARLRVEQEQRDRELDRRLISERLDIARELHDVTAHALAVVGIQAGLARELMHDDPEAAQEALDTARRVNVEAIGELQAAVRVLRTGDESTGPSLAPTPGVAQLPALVDRAVSSGLHVELVQTGAHRTVAPAVGLTLYRIVQESLTNVLRHAAATRATVELEHTGGNVRLRVTDDGRGPTATYGEGHGLAGMRERATSVGGTFAAGPGERGGFVVDAWLPGAYPPPSPAASS